MRGLALALVLFAPLAFAGGKGSKHKKKAPPVAAQVVHPFADETVAKLQVVDTRAGQGVIENKQGEVVLVRAGDLLGAEGLVVSKVTRGCVVLKGPETELTLCADVPEVPRT